MTAIPEGQQDVPRVPHFDLPDNVAILDVRDRADYDKGHAPEAVHIPLGELESRVGEVSRDGQLVVTCGGGSKMTRAVAYLRDQGIDAVALDGGMREWAKQNRPMSTSGTSGTPTAE